MKCCCWLADMTAVNYEWWQFNYTKAINLWYSKVKTKLWDSPMSPSVLVLCQQQVRIMNGADSDSMYEESYVNW